MLFPSFEHILREITRFDILSYRMSLKLCFSIFCFSPSLFYCHSGVVRDVNNEDESQDPFYEVKGIITLEGRSLYVSKESASGQMITLLDSLYLH